MEEKKQKQSAIEKALDILEVFMPDNVELGTIQVSEKLDLHKATASRILLLLTHRGFLQQNPENKKFSLGRKSLLLGRAVVSSLQNDIVAIAKPYIDKLRTLLDETVALEQLIGDSTVLVYIAEGLQRHRMAGGLGDRLPINAAAGAKTILAYSDPELVGKLFNTKSKLDALTPKTILDTETLLRQFNEIRLKGYSFDNEEIDIGINAFGFPIFNHNNLPVASISVIGPSHRVNLDNVDEIVGPALETTRKISSLLMQPLQK